MGNLKQLISRGLLAAISTILFLAAPVAAFGADSTASNSSQVMTLPHYDIQMKSTIKGNSEQPSLIFILPWKKDLSPTLPDATPPLDSFNYLLKPVNKDVLELEAELMAPANR